jgi:hypothetical protein
LRGTRSTASSSCACIRKIRRCSFPRAGGRDRGRA